MKQIRSSYEYRVVWKSKHSQSAQRKIHQRRSTVLSWLYQNATTTPWLGTRRNYIRKSWYKLAKLLGVPFAGIATMKSREVVIALQSHRPEKDYCRVEQRLVGPWVEVLDPLTNMRTYGQPRVDAKQEAMFDEYDAMTQEQLDEWRFTPTPEREAAWMARQR